MESILSNPATIGVLTLVGVPFVLLWMFFSRYRKVGPNEALVISGRSHRVPDAKGALVRRGFRVVKGGGTFVWPLVERAEILSLEVMTIHVNTAEVYTDQGVPIHVDGIAQVKVDGADIAIATAAEQFLGRGRNEIMAVAQQTIEGHLRAILGTMKVEEIYKNRELFAQRVQEICSGDTANMGLRIISFTLRDIKDGNGYLDALGKPRLAEVKRDALMREAQMTSEAQIAQADANRDAAIRTAQAKRSGDIAKYEAEAEIAAASRTFEIKRAEFVSEVNQKKAEADLAYDLQRFKTQQLVKKEEIAVFAIEKEQQIAVQEKEILRRTKELEATVAKPADAKRYATQVEADAEKYRITMEAHGRADASKAAGLADADIIRARGTAEADSIRQRGLAEAEVIRQKGLAEAESMQKKAESFQAYNSAAVMQMFVEMLPKLAAEIAAPLGKTEKMIIVSSGSDGGGASKLTKDVASIMAQLPPVIEGLSGIRLEDLIARIPGFSGPKEILQAETIAPPAADKIVVRS